MQNLKIQRSDFMSHHEKISIITQRTIFDHMTAYLTIDSRNITF